ncbi:MAG: hypothetical protein HFE63_01030 [Clostridiales bacterium]|nr:hypothetical protein [Clostridiales bacterium]
MKTVYCPVIDDQINGSDCILIVDVAEHLIKPSALSDRVVWNEEQRQKCLKCQYHDDLK